MRINKVSIPLFVILLALTSCKEKYELPPVTEEEEKAYAGGYATGFNSIGTKVLFAIEIENPGTYNLGICYATTDKQTATASIYVNDIKHKQVIMEQTQHPTEWQTADCKVNLKKGINFIAIQRDSDDNGMLNLNYIQIVRQQ